MSHGLRHQEEVVALRERHYIVNDRAREGIVHPLPLGEELRVDAFGHDDECELRIKA